MQTQERGPPSAPPDIFSIEISKKDKLCIALSVNIILPSGCEFVSIPQYCIIVYVYIDNKLKLSTKIDWRRGWLGLVFLQESFNKDHFVFMVYWSNKFGFA